MALGRKARPSFPPFEVKGRTRISLRQTASRARAVRAFHTDLDQCLASPPNIVAMECKSQQPCPIWPCDGWPSIGLNAVKIGTLPHKRQFAGALRRVGPWRKTFGQPVMAGGHLAEMLPFEEEPLDQVASALERIAEAELPAGLPRLGLTSSIRSPSPRASSRTTGINFSLRQKSEVSRLCRS